MGQCNVKPTNSLVSEYGETFPAAYYVDMEQYGLSEDKPIFTYGAGPCLIIIVHNMQKKIGCLAHKGPIGNSPEILFNSIYTIIQKLLMSCGNPGRAHILLIGGKAFTYNPKINHNTMDILSYIADKFKGNVFTYFRKENDGFNPENALYDPIKEKVFLLSDNEAMSLQGSKIEENEAVKYL
jgi:hypothetical protein